MKQEINFGGDWINLQNKESETIKLMTVQEVADYLRFNKDSVYKLVKTGELPAAMILNKLRFDRNTVEEYFRQKKNKK